MIRDIMRLTRGAFKDSVRAWRVQALLAALYVLLLVVLYLFIRTGEGTAPQVALTMLFVALAPVIFFVLQATIVRHALGETTVRTLLRQSLRDAQRLALVSLPLIAVAVGLAYFLHWAQPHLLYGEAKTAFPAARPEQTAGAWHLNWSATAFSTARWLIFGLVLPLAAIHLWIAAANKQLKAAVKGPWPLLGSMFAARSVLIYTVGLVVFAILPAMLLLDHTPISRAWLDMWLFGARLLASAALLLFGWELTVKVLAAEFASTRALAKPDNAPLAKSTS